MLRKIIGITLIVISCLLIITFISQGLIFPHLSGPIFLGIIGIVVLAVKRKVKV